MAATVQFGGDQVPVPADVTGSVDEGKRGHHVQSRVRSKPIAERLVSVILTPHSFTFEMRPPSHDVSSVRLCVLWLGAGFATPNGLMRERSEPRGRSGSQRR